LFSEDQLRKGKKICPGSFPTFLKEPWEEGDYHTCSRGGRDFEAFPPTNFKRTVKKGKRGKSRDRKGRGEKKGEMSQKKKKPPQKKKQRQKSDVP